MGRSEDGDPGLGALQERQQKDSSLEVPDAEAGAYYEEAARVGFLII